MSFDLLIESAISAWHGCAHHDHPLHETLGLTWSEYQLWVEKGYLPEDWSPAKLQICGLC